MNEISISNLRKLGAEALEEMLPVAVTVDGKAIAVILSRMPEEKVVYREVGRVQCPNCKLQFDASKQGEPQPYFFSSKHPKG